MWVLGLLADTKYVMDSQTKLAQVVRVIWPSGAENSALHWTNILFSLYPSNGAKKQMDTYRTDWYFL